MTERVINIAFRIIFDSNMCSIENFIKLALIFVAIFV
jgi:hypothetical protein